jgi:hypothetical protein
MGFKPIERRKANNERRKCSFRPWTTKTDLPLFGHAEALSFLPLVYGMLLSELEAG